MLQENTLKAKPALRNGEFERLVRAAGFDRVICVSNMIQTIQMVRELGVTEDGMDIVYRYCDGAFSSENWLRSAVELIDEPDRRAREIDFDLDWWYVDDLAEYYLRLDGRGEEFDAEQGHRVCVPDKDGQGGRVKAWLDDLSRASA